MPTRVEKRVFGCGLHGEERDGGRRLLRGYAAMFNRLSEDLGGFKEQIAPGAFEKSLRSDIRALVNHDASKVIGRTASGTLHLKEDRQGLAVEIDLPETTYANDLFQSVQRGDINQMSFGFQTILDEWKNHGTNVRTLLEVKLLEISTVTFAAYPDTSVAVASLRAWRPSADARSRPPRLVPSDDLDALRHQLDWAETGMLTGRAAGSGYSAARRPQRFPEDNFPIDPAARERVQYGIDQGLLPSRASLRIARHELAEVRTLKAQPTYNFTKQQVEGGLDLMVRKAQVRVLELELRASEWAMG